MQRTLLRVYKFPKFYHKKVRQEWSLAHFQHGIVA